MSDLGPTGQAGSPGLLEAYELLLDKKGWFRKRAIELLEKYELLDAIDIATGDLRRAGFDVDALYLFNSTKAFRTWDSDHLEQLRRVGLEVVRAGHDPSFTHHRGPWKIEHKGNGKILVQGPAEFMCQGPDAPDDKAEE